MANEQNPKPSSSATRAITPEQQNKLNEDLHDAVMLNKGSSQKITALLAAGADANSVIAGKTPLISLLYNAYRDQTRSGLVNPNPVEDPSRSAMLLIGAGADVKAVDIYGSTALHYAARAASVEVVKALTDRGANTNALDNAGSAPLHYASWGYEAKPENIDALIAARADVNAKNKGGVTPLSQSLENERFDNAKRLIDAGADVRVVGSSGYTKLIVAAGAGSTKEVKQLIAAGEDVNEANKHGSPLFYASYKGNPEMVQLLLNAGAKVNEKNRERGFTPLHASAYTGNAAIAALLIKADANVNAVDGFSSTPLHQAAEYGNTEMVELLLHKGAKVNTYDTNGSSPLIDAAIKGHSKVVKMLTAAGADVNKAAFGGTPLRWAAKYGHTETAKALIAAGANVNEANTSGFTALNLAAYYGHVDTVAELMRAGADSKVENADGRNAAEIIRKEWSGQEKRDLLNALKTKPDPDYIRTAQAQASTAVPVTIPQNSPSVGTRPDEQQPTVVARVGDSTLSVAGSLTRPLAVTAEPASDGKQAAPTLPTNAKPDVAAENNAVAATLPRATNPPQADIIVMSQLLAKARQDPQLAAAFEKFGAAVGITVDSNSAITDKEYGLLVNKLANVHNAAIAGVNGRAAFDELAADVKQLNLPKGKSGESLQK